MEVTSHMQVPEDVQFDERLFESNGLLKQYWENSVKGRSEQQNLLTQRSAEEDDARNETFQLFETLSEVKKAVEPIEEIQEMVAEADREDIVLAGPAWPEDVEIKILPKPQQMGPTLQAKSIPGWGWAVIGVLIGVVVFLLLFVFQNQGGRLAIAGGDVEMDGRNFEF